MVDKKYCLNYLRELLKSLSCDSYTQQQMVPKELMWNISSDIANEWDYENIKFFVKNLLECNLISIDIEESIKTICNNFDEVSLNGVQFDQTIWTTEGFAHHPFWEHQRKLAKYVLNELDKLQL
ncbi:MAG: hypothetical protein BHW39_01830 [Firmicutes bacterium CAG:552_39_19]|nr:MAG: hypothetical protein BHW39_01830 [Firmicutes bacterium CAG:552_39_19]